ncbi:hypothetical protein [Rhodopseudomonas pseudopalustris]|uniref:Uncharacterized protein n=2 Tax=Rhodopseudomonas TaxID=1073 RepID=Q13C96_RHOPS|nr:hypothetical protein [Rhodopseudomonas pseudopalustris]ABE38293.1 hypothetical protein RPD_1055 [Rhodopseudomonas palustris BisB5]SEO27844.1 hypothetical protein SAMN05444123_10259 [Rhodopseudomonas pseudopalustris]
MTHDHSSIYPFQIEQHSIIYDCSFFLTDNRLITVMAMGKKHTEGLGANPPRACAVGIAKNLIAESEPAPSQEAPHSRKSLLDRVLDRFGRAEPICVHC